jgi:hypothetical protein
MAFDYLPRREAELVTWTGAFLATASADPEAYGLDRATLDEYAAVRERFVAAYRRAQNPDTRTTPAVTAKDEVRRELIDFTRAAVRACQAWRGMDNTKRAELGIPERRPRRSALGSVNPPAEAPSVRLLANGDRSVHVQLKTAAGAERCPAGVDGANLFVCYGDEPPTDPSQWRFLTGTGRARLTLNFDDMPEAATAWVAACWFDRRKRVGPFGRPASVNLPKLSPGPITRAVRVAA